MHLLLVGLALLTPTAVGLADAELAAALRGEMPLRTETTTGRSGKAAGRGIGAVVINRPLSEVWATVVRYEDKAEYQPRIKRVEILDRKPGLLKVRMEVDATFMTARYTGLFRIDEHEHAISWTLDHSATDNTVADIDGGYRLFEVAPARTLLVYRTYVDSGRSVPRFIQEYMTRRSLPSLLTSIKKRVESGGTWRK